MGKHSEIPKFVSVLHKHGCVADEQSIFSSHIQQFSHPLLASGL